MPHGHPHAGTTIRAMRKAQDLSIRELAKRAEVDYSMLARVERGEVDPSPRWLKSVVTALGRHLAGDEDAA